MASSEAGGGSRRGMWTESGSSPGAGPGGKTAPRRGAGSSSPGPDTNPQSQRLPGRSSALRLAATAGRRQVIAAIARRQDPTAIVEEDDAREALELGRIAE